MQIFVSCAKADRVGAQRVVERLEQIDQQPWVDQKLTAGQSWWDEILRTIRSCDVVVAILAPASLASQQCRYERHYATLLGKTVLPVKIESVSFSALPPDLSRLHHIDFTASDPNDQAAALIRALNRVPPRRPLPNPPPVAPPTPLSYLLNIHLRIAVPPGALRYEDQLDIVQRLENAVRSEDADERQGAIDLVRRLSERGDLYAHTEGHIARINALWPDPAPRPPDHSPSTWVAPPNDPSAAKPARGFTAAELRTRIERAVQNRPGSLSEWASWLRKR